jgi:AcrR family transcriptional regulator
MTDAATIGRPNQRRRTRKDLLEAASRLMKQGRRPTLEEVAEEALVSRATAYRYFPSVEALLREASLDVAVPEPDALFASGPPKDPIARLERVETAMHDMIAANEGALRMMLAHAVQQNMPGAEGEAPARQNRRTPLIEAALKPSRGEFRSADLKLLTQALAFVIGTESMLVTKDVLQIDAAEARRLRRWMIRALVEAARKTATPS